LTEPASQHRWAAALERARLYAILDLSYVAPENAGRVAEALIEGGIDIVQLRAKGHAPEPLEPLARSLSERFAAAGIPLIINDHADLVPASGAAGLHVGQDDLPVGEARRRIGPDRIVGKSTHSLEQAEAAAGERPDYIGFGPLFATPTKPAYLPVGLDLIREVHKRVTLPIFCIGGVKRENLDAVLGAGAKRVAIVSGILTAPDIAAYCRAVRSRLRQPKDWLRIRA
jgi:thiamine-phosphate pyrophosphorylase